MRRLLLAALLALLATPLSAAAVHAGTGKVWGTYYASRFDGRTMACGGVYREHQVTVASGRLPCGSLVRVNFRGRSVVAPVTDRCNCGIDLSRAAARKIGLLDVGAAWVEVKRVR
jgi:rare lipoprotein A